MKLLILSLLSLILTLTGCPSTPTCDDGEKNGNEVDVDCGGTACGRCAAAKRCVTADDCQSGVCFDTDQGKPCAPTDAAGCRCEAARCGDGVLNGDETDADCGGSCTGCEATRRCKVGSDCLSTVCDGDGICTASSCTDGMKNGTEGDVDCGADCPDRCAAGRGCRRDEDCATLFCPEASKTCEEASCDDKVQNGTESDVDCGGTCPTKCAKGKRCTGPDDCLSANCGAAGTCDISPCEDGTKNGTETDVDCGGEQCPACDLGKACATATDCKSNSCSNLVCRKPDCTNKQQDGLETGADCGGPCAVTPFPPDKCENQCFRCPAGEGCKEASDCLSNLCVNNSCS